MKILLINDDRDDAEAILGRLPGVTGKVFDHAKARANKKFDYDYIVIDNDANNMNDAKGPATLAHIKKIGTKARLYYTSFTPAGIDDSVQNAQSITILKTTDLADALANELGLNILPKAGTSVIPKVTLILTYNHVESYPAGIYGDGSLVIISYDKRSWDLASEVIREKADELYTEYNWALDRETIKNIFIYDGLYAGDWARRVASALGHDVRRPVNLVGCRCNWEKKVAVARSYDMKLFKCECGGVYTLGVIADIVLGAERNGSKQNIGIPHDLIINGSSKDSL